MRNWPALILAPSLALAEQSVTYALVTPSCARQTMIAIHVIAALSLVLSLWWTAAAWLNWRRHATLPAGGDDRADNRDKFFAVVATMTGSLSSLVILTLWLPNWILSPCAS